MVFIFDLFPIHRHKNCAKNSIFQKLNYDHKKKCMFLFLNTLAPRWFGEKKKFIKSED